MIHQDVGYDAGKKIHGRKRHLTVDLLGLVLRVLVTSASIPERQGAKRVLKRVHDMGDSEALPPPAVRVNRLHTIWMDGGYRGEDFMRWVIDMFRWVVEIVLRPLEGVYKKNLKPLKNYDSELFVSASSGSSRRKPLPHSYQ
jgi:putative transposase